MKSSSIECRAQELDWGRGEVTKEYQPNTLNKPNNLE